LNATSALEKRIAVALSSDITAAEHTQQRIASAPARNRLGAIA
jgi:hypothetical protein